MHRTIGHLDRTSYVQVGGDYEASMSFDSARDRECVVVTHHPELAERPFRQHWILLVAAWKTASPQRGLPHAGGGRYTIVNLRQAG